MENVHIEKYNLCDGLMTLIASEKQVINEWSL